MIDIENAKKVFVDYVDKFDVNNGRISLKKEHILRVASNCRKIAQNLNLTEEQINLAELIGIFHDIGRFEQVARYNTFSDKDSVNHAEYSVKILYDEGLIKKFNVDNVYNNIIKKSVLNHNKAKIEDGLSDEELLFAKIIRDADKIDIYNVINLEKFENVFWYSSFDVEKISDIVINDFIANKSLINYANIKNNADQIVMFYAYVYDFNFKKSLQIIKENRYIEKYADKIKEYFESKLVQKQSQYLLSIVNDYLENNI